MMNNGNDARPKTWQSSEILEWFLKTCVKPWIVSKEGGEAMSSNEGVCDSSTDKGVVVTLGGV